MSHGYIPMTAGELITLTKENGSHMTAVVGSVTIHTRHMGGLAYHVMLFPVPVQDTKTPIQSIPQEILDDLLFDWKQELVEQQKHLASTPLLDTLVGDTSGQALTISNTVTFEPMPIGDILKAIVGTATKQGLGVVVRRDELEGWEDYDLIINNDEQGQYKLYLDKKWNLR